METTTITNRSLSLRVRAVESARAQELQAAKPDVIGTVSVSIFRMATRFADKLGLRFSVCLFSVTALAALSAGISRIDLDQWNTCHRALVSQKASKLSEAPIMQPCPFPLSGPDPRSNAGQFLYGNSTVRAFCGLDDAFGNCVIYVAGKIRLSPAALPQKTLGGFRSFALQLAAKGSIAIANLVQVGTGIIRSIRVVGDLHDAHIHTQTVNSFDLPVLWDFDSYIQEPLSFSKDQVELSARIRKQRALFLTTNKRYLGSTSESPDAYRRSNQAQRQDAGIIGNAAVFSENTLNFSVELVSIRDLGVEQADNLSGQWKLVSNLTVKGFVQREAAKLLHVPSQLRQAIGRAVHSFQCIAQSLRLFWRRQQFNLHSQFHCKNLFSNI
jgi:hypothetical protein